MEVALTIVKERALSSPDKGKDAMASVPDAVMRPGAVADSTVAAPDEAIPWWCHPCPPEILSQGKGSRAYQNWRQKRYRSKRKAEFLKHIEQIESRLQYIKAYHARKRAEQQRVAEGLEAAHVVDVELVGAEVG